MAQQSELDRKVINVYRQRKTQVLSHLEPFFSKVARRYDLYRGVYRQQFAQFRNHVQVPYLFAAIQTAVARKVQSLFSSPPYVEFLASSPEDAPVARRNTALVNLQMEEAGIVTKANDLFLSADMYGTGWLRYGWKTVRKMQEFRILDAQGQNEVLQKGITTQFDGPDFQVKDILDVWPQMGKSRIEDCAWVMDRDYVDLTEIEALAALGLYDQNAVSYLKANSVGATDSETGYEIRSRLYRTASEYEARRDEKFAKPVQIVDMIGEMPPDLCPDGITFRIITVANDGVVLRNRPFPFFCAHLPFLCYTPMRDPHYMHGVGKIEICEKLQYLTNRWVSQKADALDLLIDPMWLVNRQAGVDTQNLYSRAGRVIGVDGAVDDSVIRALMPDMRGIQLANPEVAQMSAWMQEATGVDKTISMGMETANSRTTAHEIGVRQEGVMTRQTLEGHLAEKMIIEPLAEAIRDLNRQYLRVPKMIRMLGSNAAIDERTGYPLPMTYEEISLDDLNVQYSAQARGVSQMQGKYAQRQDLTGLLQVIGAIPGAPESIKWPTMLRYTFQVFDMPNPTEFLQQQPNPAGALGSEPQGGQPAGPEMGLAQLLGQGGLQ